MACYMHNYTNIPFTNNAGKKNPTDKTSDPVNIIATEQKTACVVNTLG